MSCDEEEKRLLVEKGGVGSRSAKLGGQEMVGRLLYAWCLWLEVWRTCFVRCRSGVERSCFVPMMEKW